MADLHWETLARYGMQRTQLRILARAAAAPDEQVSPRELATERRHNPGAEGPLPEPAASQRWRNGKCREARVFMTHAEALEAAGLRD